MKEEKLNTIKLVSEISDAKSSVTLVRATYESGNTIEYYVRNGKKVSVRFAPNGLVTVSSFKGLSGQVANTKRYLIVED